MGSESRDLLGSLGQAWEGGGRFSSLKNEPDTSHLMGQEQVEGPRENILSWDFFKAQ